MDINKRKLWLFRLLLVPLAIIMPWFGLIFSDDNWIYSLVVPFMYLSIIAISVNYDNIKIYRLIYPHYNYITSPISNRGLLIREIKHILTHKYTCYVIIANWITLIVSDITMAQKLTIGSLFIALIVFFTTFVVFFCNADFKFTWLKRNVIVFTIPYLIMINIKNYNYLFTYIVSLLIMSILLSVVYYRKALKAMQEPFEK